MIPLYATLLGLFTAGKGRLDDRIQQLREQDPERGALTVEQVIITAGLLGLAIALVAVIVAAVNGRMAGIF